MDEQAKRFPAVKVQIKDIVNGEFIKKQGYESSYLKTKSGEEISRTRIMATIVEKYLADDKNYATLTLDDSTETIRAKVFKEDVKKLNSVNIGDVVDIIGKIREYEEEVYILPEIITQIKDPNWELLRKLEIIKSRSDTKRENLGPNILKALDELDSGDGVKVEDLVKHFKDLNEEEVMESLRNLMMSGEVFEPRSRILKVVK